MDSLGGGTGTTVTAAVQCNQGVRVRPVVRRGGRVGNRCAPGSGNCVRTARAKGLTTVTVDVRHVLRNALIPIVTILAFSVAGLIGGSFIVETIMGIPGIGKFVVESVFNRDYPVIMAVTLVGASAFVLANLLADVTYAFIDPRIRYR